MRKLFAFCLIATFILGDYTISHLSANAASVKDDRAENLLRQAREAIGGDAAINAVTNLLINGKVSHKVKLPSGEEQAFGGNVEMGLELPDKLYRNIKIGDGEQSAENGKKVVVRTENIVVHRTMEKREDAEKLHRQLSAAHGTHLSALLFGLLAKTSTVLGAAYNYIGEGTVDGTAADIVEATGSDSGSVKLYLDKQSHLPLMVSYRGVKPAQMFIMKKEAGAAPINVDKDVVIFNREQAEAGKSGVPADRQNRVVIRKSGENGEVREIVRGGEFPRVQMEEAEIQLKFSDYRSVNGLMLPFRLVESTNGQESEAITVENYQLNAANLNEKFKTDEIRMRVPKVVERVN